jgi:lysyl-tRNA synthetase class 2
MLEWYRVGDTMTEAMQLLGQLAETVLVRQPTETLSYQIAFERFAGFDPHRAPLQELAEAARDQGIELDAESKSLDRDGWLNLILTHVVEPHLGRSAPTIVYDWPASQAALAVVRPEQPPVAERFELFVDGMELANGYNELLDATELLRRNEENNRLRVVDGRNQLPTESRLLSAMESGMPACCGVALGVDRLVMLALGAGSIDEVIAFPFENA